MGLLDKLLDPASTSLFGQGGQTPGINPIGTTMTSPLHNQYSINGTPMISLNPQTAPSNLDLNGATPDKYWDNRPH